jgi:FkbM family methyltransferase
LTIARVPVILSRVLTDLAIALGDRLGRHGPVVGVLRPAYAAWLRVVYGRRGVSWRLNGEPLRIDPMVRHLIPQTNERSLFEYLRSGMQKGDIVLDVGAFLGAYAILEARWVGEEGRVVAFEPSPSSFAVLTRHLAMNGLSANRVDARQAAVGAAIGRRELITFDDEPYRNQIAGAASASQPGAVDLVTIDAITAELGRAPDWIRMDVQGLEFEVLEGATETLREGRGRTKIVAEMHPLQWPEFGVDPAEATERFSALGLTAKAIDPAEPLFTQGGHAVLERSRAGG